MGTYSLTEICTYFRHAFKSQHMAKTRISELLHSMHSNDTRSEIKWFINHWAEWEKWWQEKGEKLTGLILKDGWTNKGDKFWKPRTVQIWYIRDHTIRCSAIHIANPLIQKWVCHKKIRNHPNKQQKKSPAREFVNAALHFCPRETWIHPHFIIIISPLPGIKRGSSLPHSLRIFYQRNSNEMHHADDLK